MTDTFLIPFDYHSHHHRCGHAAGELSDYIDAALAVGMHTFGVSDHGPAYFEPGDHAKPGTQMARSELARYVREARQLQERRAGQIEVRVGIEADFIEAREDELASWLNGADAFDYALGSVHYSRNRSIFARNRWADEVADETYADYYRQVALAAGSGLFDILSHLTAVEAYGPPIAPALADELYPPAADAVARSGCIVEVNTSGYRKMGGDEPFPNRRMLKLLIERGVPLTFGSDCHRPDEVGYGRERVAALLTELGVDVARPAQITVRRGPLWVWKTDSARKAASA